MLLLNDFTALALSLPHLGSADLRQVGAGTSVELAAKAVLGPGAGLGVSGVLFHRGCWLALSGGGGHCSLAPTDARESAILALAWRELGHVSSERLVSGSGLPLLNRLVAAVDGRREEPLSTAEIVSRALGHLKDTTDGWNDERLSRQRAQIDQPHAIRKCIECLAAGLNGQSRLSDPARSHQRDETVLPERLERLTKPLQTPNTGK